MPPVGAMTSFRSGVFRLFGIPGHDSILLKQKRCPITSPVTTLFLRCAFLERCDQYPLCFSYRTTVRADAVEFTSRISSDVRLVTAGTVHGRDIFNDDERTTSAKAFCHLFDDSCFCTAEITLHDRYSR
jgi:hypothetical protein